MPRSYTQIRQILLNLMARLWTIGKKKPAISNGFFTSLDFLELCSGMRSITLKIHLIVIIYYIWMTSFDIPPKLPPKLKVPLWKIISHRDFFKDLSCLRQTQQMIKNQQFVFILIQAVSISTRASARIFQDGLFPLCGLFTTLLLLSCCRAVRKVRVLPFGAMIRL